LRLERGSVKGVRTYAKHEHCTFCGLIKQKLHYTRWIAWEKRTETELRGKKWGFRARVSKLCPTSMLGQGVIGPTNVSVNSACKMTNRVQMGGGGVPKRKADISDLAEVH